MKPDLTETDKDVLASLPDKWFSPDDLPVKFSNRYYRCKRLEEKGYLKRRVTGQLPNLSSEFRKIKKA